MTRKILPYDDHDPTMPPKMVNWNDPTETRLRMKHLVKFILVVTAGALVAYGLNYLIAVLFGKEI